IHPDGPADGKLEDGDVLVAVNGRAVTTAQASEELDALEAGEPVRLTVRRGSRLLNVEVTPTRSCQRVWLSAGTDAEAPEAGRRAAVQQHLDS
ncbi:MAG: PDZ domain-containing protein, partial [Gammaproteobacteria bacterium]|nr:PDZ domain-containing protein [Gemmatimonadota bacterium]NIU75777.1 PDZ domain-containing protein [Gammaproteobacteria bacterium]